MRVWIVNIGEPIPIGEETHDRLRRAGYLAHFLAEQGEDVVWWNSTFDHMRKRHRFDDDYALQINSRLKIILLHGCGYSRNLSFARIIDHKQVAGKFFRRAQREQRPDLILCAYPVIELCSASIRYGKRFSVPVVLDMRDMWPDIFIDFMPKPIRPLARLALQPMFLDARWACAKATAITGITEPFVDWGLKRGSRTRSEMDRAFPFGYSVSPPSTDAVLDAERFWDEMGLNAVGGQFVCCFLGTIGRQFDIENVVKAACKLHNNGVSAYFVICGIGDFLDYFKKMAENYPNVIFPGWVNAAQIYVLLRRSTVGLAPLPDRYDYLSSINNKSIEYMSAGLPVVSCPKRGVLFDLLSKENCGFSFNNGDANELSAILLNFFRDREMLKRLSENSSRIFKQMFAAEKVYSEMATHLRKIAYTARSVVSPRGL